MSNINKQALRLAAEKAKHAGEAPVMHFDQRINALNDFLKHFTPGLVLALLDEVEVATDACNGWQSKFAEADERLGAAEKRNERALSLLSDANAENVWEIIGRLKVVISGDYRSEAEVADGTGKGATA